MGIVRLKKFEEDFEAEELEIYALIKKAPNGALIYGENCLRPLAHTYATMDCETETLKRQEGILTWLIDDSHDGWGYDLENFGIYKLLVKKGKIKDLDSNTKKSWNNRFLVLDVIESNVKQNELEEIAAYVRQPKTIATEIGKFVLNRKYDWYELETPNYEIELELDEGSEDQCQVALKTFKNFEKKLSKLDNDFKSYAAKTLIEDANDWRESAELSPINEKEFTEIITISSLMFHNDGSIEAYYDDGDIFWGHCIIVSMDSDGTITDADIAG